MPGCCDLQVRARRGPRATRDRGFRVVSLYPFSQTVESAPVSTTASSRLISAGRRWCGPPPKLHPSAAVVTDPLGYHGVLPHCAPADSSPSAKRLASLAFQHIASTIAVASWIYSAPEHPVAAFPQWFGRSGAAMAMLRYGENPHQQAQLSTATHRLAGAGPGRATTRKKTCPTTTSPMRTQPGGPPSTHEQTCVAIIKHQP